MFEPNELVKTLFIDYLFYSSHTVMLVSPAFFLNDSGTFSRGTTPHIDFCRLHGMTTFVDRTLSYERLRRVRHPFWPVLFGKTSRDFEQLSNRDT